MTPPCYAHMTYMLMQLANGKVAVCLEVRRSLQREIGTRLSDCQSHTGWLQSPGNLQISFGSHKGLDGRATGPTRLHGAVANGRSGGSTSHIDSIPILELHVSQGTSGGGSLDAQNARYVLFLMQKHGTPLT